MKYELIKVENNRKSIIITDFNEKEVLKRLTYELWLKYIQRAKFRRVKYNYNYTDYQIIEFIDISHSKNIKYIHKFSEVPTNLGILNTDRLDI